MQLTVDNRVAHVDAAGAPDAPTVVLVHGAGMDSRIWTAQCDALAAAGRRVIAVDLPGHGGSDGPALGSPQAMADWLAEVLDVLEISSVAIAGHSMGALVALEAAARHPEHVHGLALLGAAPRMPVHPDLLALAEANDLRAADMIVKWGHAPAKPDRPNAAPAEMLETVRRLLAASRSGVLYTDLSACNDYTGGAEAGARVTCPTLLLLGDEDKMTPAKAGRKLAETIPNAEVVELDGCGHMTMVEAPEATSAALARLP